MIVIEYVWGNDGSAVSDYQVGDWLYNVQKAYDSGKEHTFRITTSPPIFAVRLAIAQGKMKCDQVVFKFWGSGFCANEYGAITDWPLGFADIINGYAENILRTAMKKRRESKAVHA